MLTFSLQTRETTGGRRGKTGRRWQGKDLIILLGCCRGARAGACVWKAVFRFCLKAPGNHKRSTKAMSTSACVAAHARAQPPLVAHRRGSYVCTGNFRAEHLQTAITFKYHSLIYHPWASPFSNRLEPWVEALPRNPRSSRERERDESIDIMWNFMRHYSISYDITLWYYGTAMSRSPPQNPRPLYSHDIDGERPKAPGSSEAIL